MKTGTHADVPDFARINLFAASHPLYVQRAEGLAPSLGGATYTSFDITSDQAEAKVWVGDAATGVLMHLRRLFPAAALEPASYEQWIEQGRKAKA